MSIRLWVPGTIPPGLIERAVEAAWPGAHTVTAPASPPLPPGAGSRRRARCGWPAPTSCRCRPAATPRRRCGRWPGPRPASPAASTPSCRSWPGRSPEPGSARPAAPPAGSASGQSARLSSRLLDLASPGSRASRSRAAGRADPDLAAEIRETTAKLAGPQWETLIRYAVATTAPAQARDGAGRWERRAAAAQQQARLRGLAHALASATALLTGRNWLARKRLRRPADAIGSRRLVRGDLLSVPELAALARLPADPALPGLARAGARAVPPPPAIPLPGPGVRPLGVSDTGQPRPVGLAVPDARHHLRIVGPTGVGKTTLIAGQILADADAGRGVVFIDPKGDAVTDLIARLPEAVRAARSCCSTPATGPPRRA